MQKKNDIFLKQTYYITSEDVEQLTGKDISEFYFVTNTIKNGYYSLDLTEDKITVLKQLKSLYPSIAPFVNNDIKLINEIRKIYNGDDILIYICY